MKLKYNDTVYLITMLNNQMIITTIDSQDDNFLTIKNPANVILQQTTDERGGPVLGVGLAPFHPLVEDIKEMKEIALGKNGIASIMPLSPMNSKQENLIKAYKSTMSGLVLPTAGEAMAIRRPQ